MCAETEVTCSVHISAENVEKDLLQSQDYGWCFLRFLSNRETQALLTEETRAQGWGSSLSQKGLGARGAGGSVGGGRESV